MRRTLDDAAVLEALAHPVRLDVLNHLMSGGPATASECARAVGDTPSNVSYHARVLARHGLVVQDESADGRERPWRATVTGLTTAPDAPPEAAAASLAASVQRDQRLVRDYVARRDSVDARWRGAEQFSTYGLRVTPAELKRIGEQLDAVLRPYIAATRTDAPRGAAVVHVGVHAFAQEPT